MRRSEEASGEEHDKSGEPSSGGNNLLGALRPADFNLLKTHLRRIDRRPGAVLYEPGDEVRHVYFPCGPTLISFMVVLDEGRPVEITPVGREGAVGGIVSQGRLPAYARAVVQIGGPILRLDTVELERAKSASSSLRNLFARYADCLLAQVFQSVACNAAHSIEQRTAKWLVAALDRTGGDDVRLTQEQLASMLAVGRSYIGRVIQQLRDSGAVEPRRARLVIRDLPKLRAMSCGCDETVRRHFNDVLSGVYPAGNEVPGHGMVVTNGPLFRP
ncbi:Crp/Fnr family transcriptional regulator [Ancylobacter mangrovi]|uniref:Crp/Fnr family transcriptional regulator n=1 Tax=Ancylobacter mangrovi TaxID=2972472 RepID=A0A9X2T522_9HYPH|nr:Crp/Fnr family transcriptional regulator [Ancylobacter mangrovi]MCS0494994.1 Crp/Fnr family transcriptional regulator [Ancylobacter mangrovi]MCS0502388.1 Crp/Fnr family transcriptional regulator [Ancylobacter mangrovi]